MITSALTLQRGFYGYYYKRGLLRKRTIFHTRPKFVDHRTLRLEIGCLGLLLLGVLCSAPIQLAHLGIPNDYPLAPRESAGRSRQR